MRETPAGVLFDVDGTLVDTSYLHTVTWWQALHGYGYDVPMARIHRAIGMGSDKLVDHLLEGEPDRGHDDEVKAAHLSLYAAYWERLRPLPGAADLLRAVAARGLRVVLALSASGPELAVLRKAIGVDDVIDDDVVDDDVGDGGVVDGGVIDMATSADDAGTSKPDPDILEVALDRAGLDARRAVLVGDSVWDVAAARRIALPCIGVTCGGICAAELREAGAIATYRDPAALRDELDASAIGELSRA
jgi:phosphoglycolate phosphatase-like HAD superfamily hydrolase